MQQEKESSSKFSKEIPGTNLKQNEIDPLASRKSPGIGWGGAFCFLMLARYYSAMYNNIHDCDEVFNYWEPLHYLFHKSGFQTWEYRYVKSNLPVLGLVWYWYWITLILVLISKDLYASYHVMLGHKSGFQTWEYRYVIMELWLVGWVPAADQYLVMLILVGI